MKRFVFSPLDILAPWAICLVSAALCVWGAVVAKSSAPRFVSLVTGVVFLAGIALWYLVRSNARKPDLTTKEGIGVIWGKFNKPSRQMVELWTNELRDFWMARTVSPTHEEVASFTITPWTLVRSLKDLTVICHDADHFSFWGRMVSGYAYGRDVAIGFKPPDMVYTDNLFRHEVSHHILDAAGVPWDEAKHHKIFQDAGLGA